MEQGDKRDPNRPFPGHFGMFWRQSRRKWPQNRTDDGSRGRGDKESEVGIGGKGIGADWETSHSDQGFLQHICLGVLGRQGWGVHE